ncbi:MAG: NAD(P)H-dependent oxidoreductase [Bacteroidia bacterium]
MRTLKETTPGLEIEELDLFEASLPDIFGDAVDAKYTYLSGGTLAGKPQTAWNEVLKYCQDFLSYDTYVISSPMWNFSVPYKLKQYIDVIIQAGVMFKFTELGVEGLALNKRMICITSRGSDFGQNSPMNQFDFQEPYLRAILGLIGIYDVSFINAQPTDITPEITQFQLDSAREEARSLARGFVLVS